jgi:hypothetical protein
MQVRLQKLASLTRADSEEFPEFEVVQDSIRSRAPLVLRETGRPLRLREAQAADATYLRPEMDVAPSTLQLG